MRRPSIHLTDRQTLIGSLQRSHRKTPRPATPSKEDIIKNEQEQRYRYSEKEIDEMVKDTFPASDPPANY